MRPNVWQSAKAITASALIAVFAVPNNLAAAQVSEHLVSPSDLQKAAVNASQTRQKNLDTLNGFFSSEKAQKALVSAHMNPGEVKNAISTLNDDELAQLAARASKAQSEFVAGNISDRDLLIILVAVAALILIIVAVR